MLDEFARHHRKRLASLDKIHGPRMRLVPKCSKYDGLSYETYKEKIGRDPKFKLQFLVFLYVFRM
jgi:hypothetical protein